MHTMASSSSSFSSASTPASAATPVTPAEDEGPMLSDAEAKEVMRGWDLDPALPLRAAVHCGLVGEVAWRKAGWEGRTDMCRYLKAQGQWWGGLTSTLPTPRFQWLPPRELTSQPHLPRDDRHEQQP